MVIILSYSAISTNYELNDRINNYESNKPKIIKLLHITETVRELYIQK